MNLRDIVKNSMKNVKQSNTEFSYTETKIMNGETHVTKIVKHGEAADKEIEKLQINEKINSFIKDFFKGW